MSITWLKMGPIPLLSPSAARYVWRVSTQLHPWANSQNLPTPFSSLSPAASCEGLLDSGLEALGPEAARPGEPVWGYHRIGELPMYILPSSSPPPLSCVLLYSAEVCKAHRDYGGGLGIVIPSSGFLVEVRGPRLSGCGFLRSNP